MAQNPFGDLVPDQQSSPQQGVIVRDPYRSREEDRKDTSTQLEAERVDIARQAEARQQSTLEADRRRAEAEALKAEMAAQAAIKEQATAPNPQTAKIQQQLQTDNVLQLINVARNQIGRGWSTGNVAGTGFFQGVPFAGQNSANLAATLQGLQGNVINDTIKQLKAASANGSSGYGSLTETEATRLANAVGALSQTQDAESLRRGLAAVERHYRNALALLNNEDPREPTVAEKYGIIPGQANDGEIPGARGRVTAEGNAEDDPALRGLNAQVARMIRDGADAQRVRDYLNNVRPGLGSDPQNLEAVIQYARQNPGEMPRVDLEKYWAPAGGVSQTLGEIGMSAPGSAVIGAADTITGGYLDNLTGNPDLARATMEGVSQENPWSYFGGQVAGGAMGAFGAESMLGRAGLGAVGRMRGGDLAAGAFYGSGSADDPERSRGAEALFGAALGLGGGMAGRTAARGVGTVVGGVTDPLVQALDRAGVRMTPGQIVGGGLKNFEDKMTSLPMVGNQIGARRMEGIEDFNRAAMAEAVAPIGAPAPAHIGEAGVNANQQAISGAYDAALNGRAFTADPQFMNDVAAALAYGRQIPQLGDQFDAVAASRIGTLFDNQGNISGRGFQDAIRGIRQASDAAGNEIMSYEFDHGLGMLDDSLRGLVQRQSPDVLDAFDSANAAYRNQSVVDNAVNRAINQGGTFMPSQLGMAARQNTTRFGGARAAARGDRPFYELQRAGQEVLPSSVPDSGTAGRALIPAAAFLAGGGGGYAASEGDTAERAGSGATTAVIASLLAAAPYSPAARAGIQRILVSDRPQAFRKAGEIMVNNDMIAGLLAAPATYVPLMTDR